MGPTLYHSLSLSLPESRNADHLSLSNTIHGRNKAGACSQRPYAVWNPGPLNAQLVASRILRAQHRQMFLSRKILAAAIGSALPIREAPWADHAVSRGWSDETLRHPLDARYGEERVDNWERTARNNVSDFVNIYTAEFDSDRILKSAFRAYDSLTASYGHAAAPQTEFLPTPLHEHSSFSSVVLNAFHGNHSPTWCVSELQVLSPALRVIAAIGRLARNGQIAVTQSLVRDAVALCHPDFGNNAATANAINFELRQFVELIIGSAQLLELTRVEPPTIPEFIFKADRTLPLLPDLL